MTAIVHILGPALGIIVKATILLAAAGLLTAALGRRSAAARHLVWLLALGGSVALVTLTPAAPAIAVPVPSAFVAPSPSSDIVVTATTSGATTSGHVAVASTAQRASAVGGDATQAETTSLTFSGWLRHWLLSPAVLTAFLVLAWGLGAVIVLIRCIGAHFTVARLLNRSIPVAGVAWKRLIDDAATHVGVPRRVAVVLSDDVGGPITSGVLRPVIILPIDAAGWNDERRRVVLLHELAHVARFDYVAQLIAAAACAVFWFHPAMWLAASRMRIEAEHAADDRVLSAGLTSDRYAMHLVELARRAAIGAPAAVAVGIAHRTHIERRVHAMLDTTRARAAVSPRAQMFAVAVTFAVLVPLAGLRTVASAATPTSRASTAIARSAVSRIAPAVVRATTPIMEVADRVESSRQGTDSTFERTLAAESGGRLTLDLDTGGDVTIRGWDEPRARLRVRLGGRDWRDTRVSFERVDGGIRLRSDRAGFHRSSQTSHSFELWVPRRSDVRLESAGGSVSIEEVEGTFSGSTGGGSVVIHDARGRASLSTGGGDINVSQSNLSGTVSTGGGVVTLSQVSGGLRGSSGSGPVIYGEGRSRGGRGGDDMRNSDTTADLRTVTISGDRDTRIDVGRGATATVNTKDRTVTIADGPGRLHITKAGGSIRLGDAPDGGTVRTGGGDIIIERAAGDLTVSTGGGDIEISRTTGSATVGTGAGDVHITVVDDDGREHTIDVSSGSGTVELVLPRSLDARVELETAYTERFGRKTRIDSDWSFERTESREWESPNGSTPRKFVRATGTLGNGRGLIRVTTVNGDVIVRRAQR